MRYAAHVRAAVIVLDMATYNDDVSIEEVSDWISRHPSYTGIDQSRLAVPLADENAWSPAEVEFRIDWTEMIGRPPPDQPSPV